ncbi:MAG: DNA repair protein RecN [Gammaproteobacteria bacterium]
MLRSLSIQNFAILENLDIDFEAGLSVFTGETGAGKSILLDALSAVLGAKADAQWIKPGSTRAEVSACFCIEKPEILDFLKKQDLLNHQDNKKNKECLIRRVLVRDGYSRAYINGSAVTQATLKALGDQLVDLHGQHQYHALLRADYQRSLLDFDINSQELLLELRKISNQGLKIKKQLEDLLKNNKNTDKLALLKYQLAELAELNLQATEVQDLEQRIKVLSQQEFVLEKSAESLKQLESLDLYPAMKALEACAKNNTLFKNISTCVQQANLALQEAISELQGMEDKINLDAESLEAYNQRLSHVYTLSRKHKVPAEGLYAHQTVLESEIKEYEGLEEGIQKLSQELETLILAYQNCAARLSQWRKKESKQFKLKIQKKLGELALPFVNFEVSIIEQKQQLWNKNGWDEIDFLISLNPGHPPGSLKKIASGGELSRISLAIQVIAAEKMKMPIIVFDEIDSGIGGKTAQVVADLIRELALNTQVICISHLAQIAAKAQQHYLVSKSYDLKTKALYIEVKYLNSLERPAEIARLLSGSVSDSALEHASVLLSA